MKIIISVLILFVIVLNGCKSPVETVETELEEKIEEEELQAIEGRLPGGRGLPDQYMSLSDIQVSACNTAHEAGTCDSRLEAIGIVLKGECCEVLNKCC